MCYEEECACNRLKILLSVQIVMTAMTKEDTPFLDHQELRPYLQEIKDQMASRDRVAAEASERCKAEAAAAKEAKEAERRAQSELQMLAAARQANITQAKLAAAEAARSSGWSLYASKQVRYPCCRSFAACSVSVDAYSYLSSAR